VPLGPVEVDPDVAAGERTRQEWREEGPDPGCAGQAGTLAYVEEETRGGCRGSVACGRMTIPAGQTPPEAKLLS